MGFDLEEGRPRVARITALTRRPYQGTMVRIRTSMGRQLKVTADHPVVVSTVHGLTMLPAAAIAPGDQLLALSELPVSTGEPPLDASFPVPRVAPQPIMESDTSAQHGNKSKNRT